MAVKPEYGVDAPNVIRNLLIGGAVCILLVLAVPKFSVGNVVFEPFPGLLYTAASLIVPAVLMIVYAKVGKFRHRDRMLEKVAWTGEESVLDVGTGRGLLLIGAAKRLTAGHATGIDIWNAEDLSGNSPDAVLRNVGLEGVGERTTVKSENARKMSFEDGSFDVVLSNLCLHNIYETAGRAEACREIARVLKPGGAAVISDFRHMRQYADELGKAGLAVQTYPLDWTGTFPPLRILAARKPA